VYNLQGIEIAKNVERWKDGNIETWNDIFVKATLGWHPGECCMDESDEIITADNIDKKMERLKNLYLTNKHYVVAIGET